MTRQSDSLEGGERGELGERGDRGGSSARGDRGGSSARGDRGGSSARATRTEFLVSFLVDARGGTMTACRKGS